ncbi:MAG: serine/threonine protein phosphatase, partial [Bacteroidota bacterium]
KPDWDDYEATRDRAAENTQLFQLISIDGETLRYEAYTAIGELYDAFELVKQEKGPNKFIELQDEAIPPFTHENTIPYRLEKSQGN